MSVTMMAGSGFCITVLKLETAAANADSTDSRWLSISEGQESASRIDQEFYQTLGQK